MPKGLPFLLAVAMLAIAPDFSQSLATVSRRAAIAAAATATTFSSIASLYPRDKTYPLFVNAASAATTESTAPSSDKPKFQRYPQIRFISALGDPKASSGTAGAETWGLWRDDPGPRGVFLRNYESSLAKNNNVAPAGWKFDNNDWWLEEHGLIMSTPDPLPRKKYDKVTQQVVPFKRYVVTGDREVTTVLTVFEDGRWELQKGTLYDVTHLPCRSARYTTPSSSSGDSSNKCSPTSANQKDFPVKPGAEMPLVSGCSKQDYAVLFVLGEEV